MATATTTKNARQPVESATELLAGNIKTYIHVKNAYEQCDDEIRAVVDEMVQIFQDVDATQDEKQRATLTIVEALFPMLTADFMDACEVFAKGDGKGRAELIEEEASFAKRVEDVMRERGMTQEELGARSGVGQSAISNMLNRQCRPQRRTIRRIAEALEVSPDSLWPGFSAQ